MWLAPGGRHQGPEEISGYLAAAWTPGSSLEIEQHGAHAVLRAASGPSAVIELRDGTVVFGADATGA